MSGRTGVGSGSVAARTVALEPRKARQNFRDGILKGAWNGKYRGDEMTL